MLSSGDWDSKRTSSPTSTIAGRLLVGPRAAVVLSGDWCGARTAIAAKNAIEEVAAIARGGEASLGWRSRFLRERVGEAILREPAGCRFFLAVRNREIARRRQEGQQNEQLEQLAQGRSLHTPNRRTTLDSKGNIYASAPTGGTIYHVTAGAAAFLSNAVSAPQGLAFGSNGLLLAVNGNPSNPQILSIDPSNGNALLLADNSGNGSGPAFGTLRALTVAPDGEFYATDVGNNEIFEINPLNGNRTIVSGNGVGGTTFGALTYGIAVDPAVPEPSALALGISALVAGSVLFWNRRRSRLLDGCRSVHSH